MLKLGTNVTDIATGLDGMLTHEHFDMGGGPPHYSFQPNGLNKETRNPVEDYWIEEGRIKGGIKIESPAAPLEVLGTVVIDKATDFTGMAIGITRHLSGCFHVLVKPEGTLKSGEAIKAVSFDIRRLKGPKIPKLTEAQEEADKVRHPSPMPFSSNR